MLLSASGATPDAAVVDWPLVRAVCLASSWADRLARAEIGSAKALAREQGFCNHYAARLMPLAWLAPDLTQQIIEGRQPPALTLGALVRQPLPTDWNDQRRLFEALS